VLYTQKVHHIIQGDMAFGERYAAHAAGQVGLDRQVGEQTPVLKDAARAPRFSNACLP